MLGECLTKHRKVYLNYRDVVSLQANQTIFLYRISLLELSFDVGNVRIDRRIVSIGIGLIGGSRGIGGRGIVRLLLLLRGPVSTRDAAVYSHA